MYNLSLINHWGSSINQLHSTYFSNYTYPGDPSKNKKDMDVSGLDSPSVSRSRSRSRTVSKSRSQSLSSSRSASSSSSVQYVSRSPSNSRVRRRSSSSEWPQPAPKRAGNVLISRSPSYSPVSAAGYSPGSSSDNAEVCTFFIKLY